jgi:hypothetical protein
MGEHGPLGDLPFERLEAGVQLVEVAGHDLAHKLGERQSCAVVHAVSLRPQPAEGGCSSLAGCLVGGATVPEAVDTMSRVLDDMRALGCR